MLANGEKRGGDVKKWGRDSSLSNKGVGERAIGTELAVRQARNHKMLTILYAPAKGVTDERASRI